MRGLVEGFAGGIVERFAEQRVAADAGDAHQLRVPARDQQRDEREIGRIGRQQRRQQVAFEMMHADRRHAEREGQRRADAGADQQRAGESGALGVGDGVDGRRS